MNTALEQNTLEMPVADTKKIERAMELINSLDFTMVKRKLMDEEEGQGWDEEYTNHVEQRYKRFLCMLIVNDGHSVVPTKNIDQFWHQHILDTRAYAKDCQTIMGKFIHHFPYFGMRSEQDAQDLLDSFEETKAFYFNLFGEEYTKEFNDGTNSSKCHRGTTHCIKCEGGCSSTTKCR
jgi:hypothetical protein